MASGGYISVRWSFIKDLKYKIFCQENGLWEINKFDTSSTKYNERYNFCVNNLLSIFIILMTMGLYSRSDFY